MRKTKLNKLSFDEFAAFCLAVKGEACSNCGRTAIIPTGAGTMCAKCKCTEPPVPSLEQLYGAPGNNWYYDGGTGEMRNGKQSISGKRRELFEKAPMGNRQGDAREAGIRVVAMPKIPRRGVSDDARGCFSDC